MKTIQAAYFDRWTPFELWTLFISVFFLTLYPAGSLAFHWSMVPALADACLVLALIARRHLKLCAWHIQQKHFFKALGYTFVPLVWGTLVYLGLVTAQLHIHFSPIAMFWMQTGVLAFVMPLTGWMLASYETTKKPDKHVVFADNKCPVCRKEGIADVHYQLCSTCKKQFASEIQRVRTQKYRAKKLKEPATLTVVEWLQTLQSFNNLCAHCQKAPFQVMDHFIPLGHGVGTTKENCIPSCARCNGTKSNKHPEK